MGTATGLPRTLILLVLLPLLTACGVMFTDNWDGTELFRGIRLDGDRSVGSELTINVWVRQGYPVPVHIACYYENGDKLTEDEQKVAFQERAVRVGEAVLSPADGKRPDDKKIELELVSFRFSVPEPGSYFIACITPAAADNGLGVSFTIRETRQPAGSAP